MKERKIISHIHALNTIVLCILHCKLMHDDNYHDSNSFIQSNFNFNLSMEYSLTNTNTLPIIAPPNLSSGSPTIP